MERQANRGARWFGYYILDGEIMVYMRNGCRSRWYDRVGGYSQRRLAKLARSGLQNGMGNVVVDTTSWSFFAN